MKEQKVKFHRSRSVYHSDEFKRGIIDEYLTTGVSKLEIQKKYGLKRHSAIHGWMRSLGYSDLPKKDSNLGSSKQSSLAKKSGSKSSTSELEAKIKLLERQLEGERLKSEFYNRMIDLAEKTYKIPVRKNSGTK